MRVLAGAIIVVLAAILAGAPSAAATDGSIPAVVTEYIAGELVNDLNDFYGLNADGHGLDFDESTTFSTADRVFTFTDDKKTDVELLNEWETRVSIAKKLVGLAIVSINAATSEPQLLSFVRSAELASALNELPATGALVHDSEHDTWLLVDGDKTTSVFLGTPAKTQEPRSDFPTPLIGLGVGLLIVILIVGLEVFMPSWRRPRPKATDLLK